MSEDRWMTPADAVRLVARYPEAGNEMDARHALFKWVEQTKVRVRALEVERWVDEPLPPEPELTEHEKELDQLGPDVFPNWRERYRGLRQSWELPMVLETTEDHNLTPEDWIAALAASRVQQVDWEAIFSRSELVHLIPGSHNPNCRVTYSGLRLDSVDIVKRIELAGWKLPATQSSGAAADERSIPANRHLDHDDLRRRAAEMRANQPSLSVGSAAASLVADLPNSPRTGKPFDARGIEKIIRPVWGGE